MDPDPDRVGFGIILPEPDRYQFQFHFFFLKISVQNIENYDNDGGGQVIGREGQEESTEQEALLIHLWPAPGTYVKNIVGSFFDKQ